MCVCLLCGLDHTQLFSNRERERAGCWLDTLYACSSAARLDIERCFGLLLRSLGWRGLECLSTLCAYRAHFTCSQSLSLYSPLPTSFSSLSAEHLPAYLWHHLSRVPDKLLIEQFLSPPAHILLGLAKAWWGPFLWCHFGLDPTKSSPLQYPPLAKGDDDTR